MLRRAERLLASAGGYHPPVGVDFVRLRKSVKLVRLYQCPSRRGNLILSSTVPDGGWVCSELLEPRTTIVFSQVQNTIEYRAGCIAARYTRFRGAAYMREAAWKTLQRSVRSLAKFLFIDRSGLFCGDREFFLFNKSFFSFLL